MYDKDTISDDEMGEVAIDLHRRELGEDYESEEAEPFEMMCKGKPAGKVYLLFSRRAVPKGAFAGLLHVTVDRIDEFKDVSMLITCLLRVSMQYRWCACILRECEDVMRPGDATVASGARTGAARCLGGSPACNDRVPVCHAECGLYGSGRPVRVAGTRQRDSQDELQGERGGKECGFQRDAHVQQAAAAGQASLERYVM